MKYPKDWREYIQNMPHTEFITLFGECLIQYSDIEKSIKDMELKVKIGEYLGEF